MLKLFAKHKMESTVYGLLNADMHSHLIPGIDDGSPDIETSLHLIRGMCDLGYKKLITTPHIMWDMYKNSRDIILSKVEELQQAVTQQGIDVEIKAAAEYFLDDHVSGLLKTKQPLLTIAENLVLVEFSLASQPLDYKEVLFELQLLGYQPVIAHPERYIYGNNREFYIELKDAGYYFQANILSFGNFYGRAVMDQANYLAKKEYYDFAGTDLHNFRHLEALHSPSITTPLKRLFDSGKIRNNQL
jgi:protein-tyrosine phosphatase